MCGIIGISGGGCFIAQDLYVGLMAMQHRGKESARIIAYNGGSFSEVGGMGEAPQAFWGKDLRAVIGPAGIGHVRYSTSGKSNAENIQPIKGEFRNCSFYLAHNGNLVNTNVLKKYSGTNESASDTRVIVEMISKSNTHFFEDALIDVLGKLRGSFNLVILFDGKIYAVKDSFGFHPLQLGIREGGAIVASESCVFDNLGAEFKEDIQPGNLLVIDGGRYYQLQWAKSPKLKFDIFEYIYFLRPDSIVHGVEAGKARYYMGYLSARKHQIAGDIIVPVPDSSNEAARGYYGALIEMGYDAEFCPWALFRPHTISRTFIEPIQEIREKYLFLKLNPRSDQIKGKKVVVVDDSLVRGNTQKVVAKILKKAGAKEINVVIASPMYLYPDFYGIDTYRVKDELIARLASGSVSTVAEKIGGIDYLGYLDLASTVKAVLAAGGRNTELKPINFYTGPFTGIYPAGTGDFILSKDLKKI